MQLSCDMAPDDALTVVSEVMEILQVIGELSRHGWEERCKDTSHDRFATLARVLADRLEYAYCSLNNLPWPAEETPV